MPQTLTNALLTTSVTGMLHVTIPKDLTTALVKMDLKATEKTAWVRFCLPPFSLIRDFRKQNTRENVSKISVNYTRYRQIWSKSTNHSPQTWRKEGLKVILVALIGGFRSDLAITCKPNGNFGNVSAGVFFQKSCINDSFFLSFVNGISADEAKWNRQK